MRRALLTPVRLPSSTDVSFVSTLPIGSRRIVADIVVCWIRPNILYLHDKFRRACGLLYCCSVGQSRHHRTPRVFAASKHRAPRLFRGTKRRTTNSTVRDVILLEGVPAA